MKKLKKFWPFRKADLITLLYMALVGGILYYKNYQATKALLGAAMLPYVKFQPAMLTIGLILAIALYCRAHSGLYLLIMDFVASVLLTVDVVYSRAFGGCVSIYMMFCSQNLGGMTQSAMSIIKPTDFLFFVDLPFLIVLEIWIRHIRKKKELQRPRCHYILATAIILFCMLSLNKTIAYWENTTVMTQESSWVQRVTPIGYHYYDVYCIIQEKTHPLTSAARQEIADWLKDNDTDEYQAASDEYKNLAGVFKGKNLIVLQMESLEESMINYKYNGQEITPNLNKILPNSLFFDNVHEQVGNGNSSDAELMTLTSLYPISRGSTFLRFGTVDYQSLPKAMKSQGYYTFAMHGDEAVFWNRETTYKSMGFDDFISIEDFVNPEITNMGADDSSYFARMVEECKKQSQNGPYFAFGISLTSHMPFEMPEDKKWLGIQETGKWADYLQAIRYLDECFGTFMRNMQDEGLLENTVIVIYGDHEGIQKYYPYDMGSLPDNQKKIPLIIYCADDGWTSGTVSTIGGEVDILPTISYLFGLQDASTGESTLGQTMMGRNLLRGGEGGVILWDGSTIGTADDLLKRAQQISDETIRGNYYHGK